jgi:3-hydroxy acid dehydrogenase / malonic semialdehyde reductase
VAQLDVAQSDDVNRVIQTLPDDFKAIDILVNNAGLAKGVAFTADNATEDINTVIDVNVKGLLFVTRAVLGGMIERNAGHVINVSSVAGLEAYKGGSIYCASKHAVQAINNALRKEMVDKNIRVTSICPGKPPQGPPEPPLRVIRDGRDRL